MARIKWKKPTAENFKSADDNAQVIVLYFGDRADDDVWFNDVDIDGLVLAEAVAAFRVPATDATFEATDGRLPVSKLDSANLWKAYGVDEADTFVVADRYGNAFATTTDCSLKEEATDVSKHFRGLRKDLRKIADAAEDLIDDGDIEGAIARLHEGLELGLVGYREAGNVSELYAELMEAGLKKVAAAGEDLDALRSLRQTYAGSDVAKEIDAAIEKAEKVSN